MVIEMRTYTVAQLIGDQHHVQHQVISHLGLPRSPCRRSAQSCEGRGPSGAPGPSPSRHRADPGSRESQCCLTIETSGQLWARLTSKRVAALGPLVALGILLSTGDTHADRTVSSHIEAENFVPRADVPADLPARVA